MIKSARGVKGHLVMLVSSWVMAAVVLFGAVVLGVLAALVVIGIATLFIVMPPVLIIESFCRWVVGKPRRTML